MSLKYDHFKNLTRTIYKNATRHEEIHTRDEMTELSCPTCGKLCYSKGWLTIRIKQSANCVTDYYAELEQRKICTNEGCEQVFVTYEDMAKHRNYHCGQNVSAYHKHCEIGVIDRRTPHGFGTPNNDKRMFSKKELSLSYL